MSNINNDLVLYLKLDLLQNTTVLDSSSSKKNGTTQGGVSLISDNTFGVCLNFDGQTGYITIPDSETLRISTYTIEVWINPTQLHTVWQGIIGKPGRNFNIWLNDQAYIHHRFHTSANTNDGVPDTPSGSIKLNEWNHVAITHDGKVATTYINGIKAAQGSSGSLIIDNTPLYIGKNLDGDSASYFKGKLANVRVYKRALSAAEIICNIETDKAGLVTYFELDEIADGDKVANAVPGIIGIAQAASLVPDDTFGASVKFDGTTAKVTVDPSMFASVTNTFTLSGWVIPTTTHQVDPQATTGVTGTSGQKYMLYPLEGGATYGQGHASAGISVGTNGVSVYEHAGDYMPPLLVWEKPRNDPAWTNVLTDGWTHIAVVYQNKTPFLYVNGQRVATGLTSTKTYIHPSDDIGGGRWGYFPGKISNVRVYKRALSEADIKQVMDADKLTLPAYRKGHPIDFSLLDENQNYVLYISDDPKASHTLTLNLKNTSTQAIQLQNGKGTQAASDNYHFELVFRQGVLSAKTLTTLRQTKTDLFKDPTQWDVAVSPDNRPDQTISLYFLYKGNDKVFNQSELRQVALQNISADAGTGIRGTQVELRLNQLVYVDDVNSPTPSPITGTRVQQLQITNQSGKQFTPLHVGFIGSNQILNDGSSSNRLRLRITNTSKESLLLERGQEKGQFILLFDVGDVQKEWAIATATDFNPMIEAKYPDGTSKKIEDVTRNQGVSPEWKIAGETLPIKELKANEHIEITLSKFTTAHPTGYTNLYVKYSVPGYWDGQFVCLIEKAPLLFYDPVRNNAQGKQEYTGERWVGIGNSTPQNLLHVGAGTSTINKDRVNVVIATKTIDAGIAIAQQYNVNVLLQASGAGGYIGTTSNHPLMLRTNNADRVVVDTQGKVGIGTPTPQNRLDVEGGAVIGATYSGTNTAPANGLLVEGNVGIGRTSADYALHVGVSKSVRLELGTSQKLSLGGNGSFEIDASGTYGGRFIVNESGNVGVGIADPGAFKLNVNGPAKVKTLMVNENYEAFSANAVNVRGNTPENIPLIWGENKGAGWTFYAWSANGRHYGTNSSIRLKENVQSLTGALEKILNIRGVYFDWKETGQHDLGFIAEEIAAQIPEAVDFEKDGKYASGMSYQHLIPVLVEAVKEQQAMIENLKETIKVLKAEGQ
ncbi:hypothetical protein AMR41_08000 [Hapalosiphon sp. MRB220]|nr:hypothetical protein AMR41_08000 [Hapalosiphon sp. MRB220]